MDIAEKLQQPTNLSILILGIATVVFGFFFRKKWIGGALLGAAVAFFACTLMSVTIAGTTGMPALKSPAKILPTLQKPTQQLRAAPLAETRTYPMEFIQLRGHGEAGQISAY